MNKTEDLSAYMEMAHDIIGKIPELSGDLPVVNHGELKKLFEGKIIKILLDRRMIEFKFILCGMYVSKLLAGLSREIPKSWYAVDFFQKSREENNPYLLRSGADICFLISSVFKERGNWRTMKPAYYKEMGMGLFYQFHKETGLIIGLHMSEEFKTMADIADHCIKNF